MHILFIHQNFPAQFGHIAAYLTQRNGFRTTYLSDQPPRTFAGVECIQYKLKGGATETSHFCARSFENAMWHSHAVYEALKARPELKPDLVVAHSGFLSTVFLREIYDCPIVNYFEYYYRTKAADMDYRPDFPHPPSTSCVRERGTLSPCSILNHVISATARRAGNAACSRPSFTTRFAPSSTASTPPSGNRSLESPRTAVRGERSRPASASSPTS